MNKNWKNYLLQNGAKQDNDGLFVFNENLTDKQRCDNSDIICDLSHFSSVIIAGEDAAEFLQGQLTNDVDKVNENTSQISGFCNNKGRMVSNFRLFQHQQNYFISCRNGLVEDSISHLQNYILRARVAIQDISEQLIHIGVSGNHANSLLSPFIEKLSTTVNSVSHNNNYIIIRVPGYAPRYEIFCSLEHAITLWESVSEKAKMVNNSCWEYKNIRNGIAFIDRYFSEAFVPQMLNMDLINGVSFEKGCYTGQEIVARTHYLGKQKRRTYRLKIISDTEPKAGEQLATATSTENQYTGTLVTIYQTAKNEYEALAVIQIKSAEEEKLKLKGAKAEISLLDLPYSLKEEESANERP